MPVYPPHPPPVSSLFLEISNLDGDEAATSSSCNSPLARLLVLSIPPPTHPACLASLLLSSWFWIRSTMGGHSPRFHRSRQSERAVAVVACLTRRSKDPVADHEFPFRFPLSFVVYLRILSRCCSSPRRLRPPILLGYQLHVLGAFSSATFFFGPRVDHSSLSPPVGSSYVTFAANVLLFTSELLCFAWRLVRDASTEGRSFIPTIH